MIKKKEKNKKVCIFNENKCEGTTDCTKVIKLATNEICAKLTVSKEIKKHILV